MQNESQNIEYKESWGRGFKKIAEEFERACLPLPTIEENGGGVMAIVQRKTIDEVIAERGGDVGVNVGVNSIEISDVKLTERQTIMVSVIKSNPMVTAKQMSETLSVTSRTIERDLAVMQKVGVIRHEGKDNAGVWVILEQGNTNS
ncbi:HTH domain-containing protein [Segatella copri]|jgi:predicted HTH transcriptional regulator|uniref:HTH domain-containing protein n=1 Tax=Segatella copri TaxID=165179 RepID=UPI0019332AAA|nr:HTH domain-containing protein [Segatella copri]MBM0154401.1 HTH domain-containing protein [Segatella copri]